MITAATVGALPADKARQLEWLDTWLESLTPAQTVFVDFDHTLLRSNSTELFLGSFRPAFLFALILKILGALAPWKLAGRRGNFVWRDSVRVGALQLLAPFGWHAFRRTAPDLFRSQVNARIDARLAKLPIDQIVIVSFGFDFIIRALLRGSRYEDARLVAPGWRSMARDRRRGKLAMLRSRGFDPEMANAVVITDSERDDADIIAAARSAAVIQWPDEIKHGAFHGAYLPFFYTARIKRTPGFLIKQVFLEELPVILLAFAFAGGALSLPLIFCLTLMFAAYVTIYEIGYAENDRVGIEKEAAPKIGEGFHTYAGYRLQPDAWIWAGLFSLAAFAILPQSDRDGALARLSLDTVIPPEGALGVMWAAWMLLLAFSRMTFWLFNASSLPARVFVYIPLHLTKFAGPIVLFPIHPMGMLLVLAQIIRTWAAYAVRRSGGDENWVAGQTARLCFFVILVVVEVAAGEMAIQLADWPLWLMLIWCTVRALPEAYKKIIRPAMAN